MGKRYKKKEGRDAPPVITGHDDRAEQREGLDNYRQRPADAPDGISGNWG